MEKVIFVTNFLGNGGAARVMSVVANYLVERNIEVEICSFLDREGTYKLNKKIKYNIIECKKQNNTLKKIERIFKLRKILKESKGATIISFEYFVNMQTIIANMFLKNRLIVSERNDPNKMGNGKIVRRLRNFLYKYIDYLVCQTLDAKAYFPQKIQEKTVIIPNPIMPNLPKRFEGKRKKEIVTFCRIEKQKNLKMMVDAFKMLSTDYGDYKLVIYGDGTFKKELEEYIKKINLENKIIINHFIQDVHSRIVDSCMFVSSSDYEGISNSMLEAMGMGLPTICTDCPCGGARMMIENNVNGILVPVGDTKAMYQAMKTIIENPEFAEKISKNAIKINDDLRQEKICKMWVEIL